jgi:hypothetical protein
MRGAGGELIGERVIVPFTPLCGSAALQVGCQGLHLALQRIGLHHPSTVHPNRSLGRGVRSAGRYQLRLQGASPGEPLFRRGTGWVGRAGTTVRAGGLRYLLPEPFRDPLGLRTGFGSSAVGACEIGAFTPVSDLTLHPLTSHQRFRLHFISPCLLRLLEPAQRRNRTFSHLCEHLDPQLVPTYLNLELEQLRELGGAGRGGAPDLSPPQLRRRCQLLCHPRRDLTPRERRCGAGCLNYLELTELTRGQAIESRLGQRGVSNTIHRAVVPLKNRCKQHSAGDPEPAGAHRSPQ